MTKIRQVKVEGIRDDATLGVVGLTNNNHFKISIEELATLISTNSNSQLKVTVYDESGDPIQINANGNVQVVLNELAAAISDNSNTQLKTTLYSQSGVPVGVTASNNQHISLEELAAAISSNSGAQLNITLFDEDGIPASVDDITETLQIIDYSHHEVHSGSHYFYSDCITLGNGATQDYLITTPNTTTWLHFLFDIKGTLSTDISIFEAGDRVGTTLQTTYNNNRNSLNVSEATLHKGTSGGTTDGTDIHPDCFGTGVAGGFGGVSDRSNEIILKQDTKYLIRITSNTNGNRLSVHFDWYEHVNKN